MSELDWLLQDIPNKPQEQEFLISKRTRLKLRCWLSKAGRLKCLIWSIQLFFGIVWREKADGKRMSIKHALQIARI